MDIDSVTDFQKCSQMSVWILMWQSMKLVTLD